MSTVANHDPRIQQVRVTKDAIVANLDDGRVISVPLAWSWRLSEATPVQRARFRLIGSGQGVHWPDVDEDISVEGMLRGTPAPRPKSAATALTKTKPVESEEKQPRPPRVRSRSAGDRLHARV